MLVAGASAGDTSSWGGALTFIAYDPPSSAWWSYGSAFIYIMLLAGGGVSDPSGTVGALTFAVGDSPLSPGWSYGSA